MPKEVRVKKAPWKSRGLAQTTGNSIRNKYMKNNIVPMSIVHFQADGYNTNKNIYEGMFDFLNHKTIQTQMEIMKILLS